MPFIYYHKALYDYFVCGVGPKAPPRPPYYSIDFFNNIKKKKEDGEDVFSMKVRDWYVFFVEPIFRNLEEEGKPLLLSRIEYLYPNVDHLQSNRCMRLSGLSSKQMSSLYCMKNDLFPSMERLYRCGKESSPRCLKCCRKDDHGHFLMCAGLQYICGPTVEAIQRFQPNIPLERIANVDFWGSEDDIFAMSWILSLLTDYIWECRRRQSSPNASIFHGIMKASLDILKNVKPLSSRYVKLSAIFKFAIDIAL